jgi:hypothetical protein
MAYLVATRNAEPGKSTRLVLHCGDLQKGCNGAEELYKASSFNRHALSPQVEGEWPWEGIRFLVSGPKCLGRSKCKAHAAPVHFTPSASSSGVLPWPSWCGGSKCYCC